MSDEGWGVWLLVMFSREYKEYICFQANQTALKGDSFWM